MNDYELYLVKRAYAIKRAGGITVLGHPLFYDPYEVYDRRKRDAINTVVAPTFSHDNARREQEAAVRRAKNRNLILGSVGGTALGAGLDWLIANKRGNKYGLSNSPFTFAGTALGLGGSALYNKFNKFKKTKAKGWDKGDAIDRDTYNKAKKQYDADVSKVLKDFNLKYTGMENPDRDAIYKGGIKLHDEK